MMADTMENALGGKQAKEVIRKKRWEFLEWKRYDRPREIPTSRYEIGRVEGMSDDDEISEDEYVKMDDYNRRIYEE